MPLPVIDGVFRCTLLWDGPGTGITPRNVIHVASLLSNASAVGDALLQAFHDARTTEEPMQLVSDDFSFDSIEVLPLDGSTASVIRTDATALQVGQDAGAPIPAQCALVSLKTAVRGPRGRGRIYLGPTGENQSSFGAFTPSAVAQAQTAWDDFLAACADNAVPLVVASYVHAEANAVVSVLAEGIAATQRRRQNQLR